MKPQAKWLILVYQKGIFIFLFISMFQLKAQQVLNGSFEYNSWESCQMTGIVGYVLRIGSFSNVQYSLEGTIKSLGAGKIIKDTFPCLLNDPSRYIRIQSIPDGKVYITIMNPTVIGQASPQDSISRKQYLKFLLSRPLIVNNYYTIRFSSGYGLLPPVGSRKYPTTIALSTDSIAPQQELDSLFIKDTVNYRDYATTFKAKNNFEYIYFYLAGLANYTQEVMIDYVRLDTCVSLLPKRTIGCVSFPLELTAAVAGKKVYWNTGDTTAAITVTQNGIYIAQIYDSLGCVLLDSVEVNSTLINTPSSIIHQTFCQGDNSILKSNYIGTYNWNTGDTLQQLIVKDTGFYWVRTTFSVGCSRVDSFYITKQMPAVLDLVKDTFFCVGKSITLTAYKPGYTNYIWNTGSTDSAISITQSGMYTVTITNGVCTIKDSTLGHLIVIPQINTDTSFCSDDSLTILAPVSDSYLWNNGRQSSNITVATAGTYWVSKTISGCMQTDSFYIKEVITPFSSFINQNICQSYSITLEAGIAQQYLWNTGATSKSIDIEEEGLYTVQKKNVYCVGFDSFYVSEKPMPIITSLSDTTVCFDQVAKILLDAGSFKSYLWQPTGQTTQTIYSTAAQVYLLSVTDSNNCSTNKKVAVMETCPEFVFIPNAFTPNADGLNDVFFPHTRNLETFNMQIVNQWGQLIFTTTDNTQGWDGKDAPIGTYVVLITYKVTGKAPKSVSGNVTLLR